MEDNDQQRPFMTWGPGAKTFLLFSLFISCYAIFVLFANSPKFAWLTASGPESGYSVDVVRLSETFYTLLIFAVPAIVFANAFPKEKLKWLKIHKPVPVNLLFIAAIAMVALIFGFLQIEFIISNSITNPQIKEYEAAVQTESNWIINMPTVSSLFMCLLMNALVPAIGEELFFRGALQQQLGEWIKNPHIAIFFTTLFFSFVHFDIIGLPTYFAGGLMLGYAFYWTGSLRTNILMHFLFNGVSILLAFIEQRSTAFASWQPGTLVTVAGLALSIGLMLLLWKKSKDSVGI